jgi:glycosyltransferase involved in cell wall biosynthesis
MSSNATNILVVIEAEIATTHLIEQVMNACRVHGVHHRTQFLDRLTASDIPPGTIPLFIRCGDPQVLSWTQALVDANRPYAYYIDDNFWRITGTTPLATYYRHPLVRASLQFAVTHALAVIASSTELARFVSRFNKNVAVLPTFFDFSIIEGVQPQSTDEIRIGFAGSPSRVDDLEIVTPAIAPILEKYPKAVFEFAGALPRGITPGPRIRFFEHTGDYNRYIRFQAERNWAIGLAPLQDHEASRSKTDNKFREYGACRIAGIYSNIPPYSDVVRDNVTGLLITNDGSSWLSALTSLLDFPDRRAALAQNAYHDGKSRYDVARVSEKWAQFFTRLAEANSTSAKPLAPTNKQKIWRRLQRIRLHMAVVYSEGGALLVIKRIIARLRSLF